MRQQKPMNTTEQKAANKAEWNDKKGRRALRQNARGRGWQQVA